MKFPTNVRDFVILKNYVAETNPLALLVIPLFCVMVVFAYLDQFYHWTGSGESNGSLWVLIFGFWPYIALKALWGISHPFFLTTLFLINLMLDTVLIYIFCKWITPAN